MNNPSRSKSDADLVIDKAAAQEIKRYIRAEILTHNVDMEMIAKRLFDLDAQFMSKNLKIK